MKTAVCMLCLAAAVAAGEVQKPERSYRISGVVVHALTGSAISQARVAIGPVEQIGTETASMITGGDGRFAFDALPAGKWSLFAERKGFERQAYLQRPEPGSPGITVVTGPGAPSEDLVFPMSPPAVIRGRVTDPDGNPIPRAVVQVLGMPLLGYKAALPIKAERADERGEYRIWGLSAAPCYVFAIAQRSDSDGKPLTRVYEHQWYPDTADARLANPIALKPGEEFTADFVLKRAKGASVTVARGSGMEALVLSVEGPAGSEVPVAVLGPGQRRTFEDITPGRYKLAVITMGAEGPETRAKGIELGKEDVTVNLPIPEPPAVSAVVRVANANSDLAGKMGVILHPGSGSPVYGEKTGPSGGMIFRGLVPGRYRVIVGGAPELYTQSVTAEGARVANGFVELPEQGAVTLKIVASGDGGRVRGRVRVGGKPVPGILVGMAPRQESDNPENYQGGQTVSDGSFEFAGVRPGEYVLFATTNWQLQFRIAPEVRKYLESGRAVRVEPKTAVEINLDLVQP